jgi:hypothetical protein
MKSKNFFVRGIDRKNLPVQRLDRRMAAAFRVTGDPDRTKIYRESAQLRQSRQHGASHRLDPETWMKFPKIIKPD